MSRPLQELQARVMVVFGHLTPELRAICTDVAQKKLPSTANTAAMRAALMMGCDPRQAYLVAKGAEKLATIRRDYGIAAFEETLRQFKSPPESWQLASGEEVVDREQSHLHGDVRRLLPEVLAQIHAQGRAFIIHSCDFGRVVGETICVWTRPDDSIVYAQRVGRAGLSRFVKNRQSDPCSVITVMLRQNDDGRYEVITAYVGYLGEHEPWDKGAREPQSSRFWNEYALVWGHEPVVPGTETTRCPWFPPRRGGGR